MSSESEKESSLAGSNRAAGLAPETDIKPKRRRRSKSMKEKREQHLEEIFERCLQMVTKGPRRLSKTETRVSLTPVVSRAEATDNVPGAAKDQPTPSVHMEVAASFTTSDGSVVVRKSLEMVAAETVAKERRQRRISMLAELEPGNHRLEWSQFETDHTDSHSPETFDLSHSFPQSKLSSKDNSSTLALPQRSPKRSLRHVQIVDVVLEESSSSQSSSCSTPELAQRGAEDPAKTASRDDNGNGTAVQTTDPCDEVGAQSGPNMSPHSCRRPPPLANGVVRKDSKQRIGAPNRSPVLV